MSVISDVAMNLRGGLIVLGPVISYPYSKVTENKKKVTRLLHAGPAVMETGLIFILPSV